MVRFSEGRSRSCHREARRLQPQGIRAAWRAAHGVHHQSRACRLHLLRKARRRKAQAKPAPPASSSPAAFLDQRSPAPVCPSVPPPPLPSMFAEPCRLPRGVALRQPQPPRRPSLSPSRPVGSPSSRFSGGGSCPARAIRSGEPHSSVLAAARRRVGEGLSRRSAGCRERLSAELPGLRSERCGRRAGGAPPAAWLDAGRKGARAGCARASNERVRGSRTPAPAWHTLAHAHPPACLQKRRAEEPRERRLVGQHSPPAPSPRKPRRPTGNLRGRCRLAKPASLATGAPVIHCYCFDGEKLVRRSMQGGVGPILAEAGERASS